MPVDPRVTPLVPMHDRFTSEREMLAHARQQADELGLDDYFVVDVDSHRDPTSAWPEVLRYMENPVMRFNSQHDYEAMGHTQFVPTPGGRGFMFQAMHGRVPHQELTREDLGPIDVPRDVELCRRAGGSHRPVLDQRRSARRRRAVWWLQAKWLRARMGSGGAAVVP